MKPTDTSSRLTGLPAAFFWGQKNQKPLAVRLADHKFKPQAPKMKKLAFYSVFQVIAFRLQELWVLLSELVVAQTVSIS